MAPDDDELRRCLRTLEAIVEDRGRLEVLDRETQRALLIAAGRVSRPERHELRKLDKVRRKKRKEALKSRDEAILDATGIRTLRRAPLFVTPPELRAGEPDAPEESEPLREARKCYVCKASYVEVHRFYDQMCPSCAELNWERRTRTADLRGRVALVTGARVKIGYQAAIKLLRAGAHTHVTTRFPHDAAARFAREPDFESYRERLTIHGIDLRHTPSVERLCARLDGELSRLDYIINNACQTVRRPPGFYRHLMDAELTLQLPIEAAATVASPLGTAPSAALSQVPLLEGELAERVDLFRPGELDADLQQVDRRDLNSWRLTLDEVPTVELLEVHLVNAVAPYVINARLRGLMRRTPADDKHIVNVSAMEGQFYRAFKTDKHPHTNMAKAALNMMTRTSAVDYVKDGIHMNSVDTGWVTDEDPLAIAQRKVEEHGFHPPLDIVDGAARIVDPIIDGVLTGEHVFGLFLKDYRAVPW
ncbi:MAG: SDR family NAD(P)-dependent oxidoreductase [Sandaracinaceae bacterium]